MDFARGATRGLQLRPVIEIVEDPSEVVDLALQAIERQSMDGKRRCSWMQKAAQRKPTQVHPTSVGGALTFEGRACCFDTLHRFEGRADLAYPFMVTCHGCRRVFRVKLDIASPVRRRR